MGIPKFFRYISERWPMILQLIEGNQIPEFDNLYLDMNSILHSCTHGNDDDVTKRMTEEEVFAKIFAYIDHLFHTIKPKKVFYMAIDGVAPRAKMNQQRARRFRSAMDAEKALEKAIMRGEEIPKGEAFDSNAITPGTEFMAKLTKNLQYFIHDKITNDSKWREIDIIFSGHEVPGEGEHKIMDFIRNLRAQKEFDSNTRHCIYGLDADLIMLGMSVHDPHFALLREEVVFGRRGSVAKSLESQNFYLLHISLLREYMQLEFQEIADELQFEYDFERILDDFILVMFVIGNDFLPNLADLHLNKGAFPVLLQTFKEALLHLDGYMNEHGEINLKRLGVWLEYLSQFELTNFEQSDIDVDWFNQQLENISLEGEKQRARTGKKLLLKQQKKIVGIVKPWVIDVMSKRYPADLPEDDVPTLKLDDDRIEENLEFLKELAFQLGLFVTHSKSQDVYSLKMDIDAINPDETDVQFEERQKSVRKTIKRYQQAILVEDQEELDNEKEIYNERFIQWKDKYYKTKLGFSYDDAEKLTDLCQNYVEGLQWVLYYYYRGCPSWGWYFHYHYAPRISDLAKGLNQIIKFNKGKPFTPFQQLMAVLPERSKNLIPTPFRPLMFDEKSPIRDFYPREVELDKNGKTADWEAVVLLSFVDEQRLIDAMAPYLGKLSPEEKIRNGCGKDLIYTFNPQVDVLYKSPLSGMFSDIEHDHCVEREFTPPNIDESQFRYGLLEGAKVGSNLLAGFPSLETIPFSAELAYNETRVFQQPSKQQSMVLRIENVFEQNSLTLDELSKRFMNKVVYTRWPFLRESKLVSIIDDHNVYESLKPGKTLRRPVEASEIKLFKSLTASMIKNYSQEKAVSLGKVSAIVKVLPVTDLVRTSKGSYVKTFSSEAEYYPLQLMVESVANQDERFVEREPVPIEKEFPQGSHVIFLGDYAYGGETIIDGYNSGTRLKLTVKKRVSQAEPTIGKERARIDSSLVKYFPSFIVAKKLQLHPLFLSKITSKFLIANVAGKHVNVGIPIKFEARHEKVLGYARRNPKGWEFSTLAIQLIEDYRRTFPDFFERLSQTHSNIPSIGQLYPELPEDKVSQILDSIVTWLKTATEKFVKVSLESDSLTKVSMQAIEEHVLAYSAHMEAIEKKQLAKVPCDAILDPKTSFTLLRGQKFDLGDRVVYVQDSGKVPLFSKGTVVGYTTLGSRLSVQVLFDNELVAANNFGGRLRTNRGLGLDASFLLNLTNRQFIYHSKASRQATEQKKNVKTSATAQRAKTVTVKPNQARELLTHIKKSDKAGLSTKTDNRLDSQRPATAAGERPVPREASYAPGINAVSANALYNVVLNQYSGNFYPPNMAFPPPPADSQGMPYHMPPGYAQPFVPMQPPYPTEMRPPVNGGHVPVPHGMSSNHGTGVKTSRRSQNGTKIHMKGRDDHRGVNSKSNEEQGLKSERKGVEAQS
ncbi:hypothetical protein HG536_0G03970 [Torulaspora globosa]|uniref:5'-3' exoribonuclease 1 n=1 Tax=Torulaspora globosa TaxID=48254 RepID=A0A7G3ZLZ9_9SACH|nr:uncharacterized protein HG536_0G03970 [Torulaspora globosa]QLL34535.1 hypothetical protein HG536_0G03970 [Torulaspora globosa]